MEKELIKAKVSKEQKELIERYSKECGMNLSDYIRSRCLKKRVHNNEKNMMINEVISLYQLIEKKYIKPDFLLAKIEELIINISEI